jgi:AraC-like DNA-binding protein
MQPNMLFAGQISNHFYLENTGKSGILGIKLQPAAFYNLFRIAMSVFTNKVVDLRSVIPAETTDRANDLVKPGIHPDERIRMAESWLLGMQTIQNPSNTSKVQQALDLIFEQNGLVDIGTIAQKINCTTRHLEREFKKAVGLAPKLFSRIIRFNYIFQLMKEDNASWISIALDSGHFDQAHFIKNFKEFTGEEPSRYGFDDVNLANFFLKK